MSNQSNAQKCPRCYGRRTITETRTEPDTASGIIYGVALGMGYFPSTKTVTETKPCPACTDKESQR